MIDTLRLTLTDYEISSHPQLERENPKTDLSTGLARASYPLWVSGGVPVTGVSAYYNSEPFSVDIKPLTDHATGCFTTLCTIRCSAPKLLNHDNFVLADGPALIKASKHLESELKAIGIKTNIKTAHISRLDAARNVALIDPCQNYFPVLSMLRASRMAKREYAGTGHLWENGQQQICAYDKLQEMKTRKQSVSGLPQNTMRFEWRLMKPKKFRDTTGMKTLGDVCSNYDQITACYSDNLKKQLFSFTVPEFNLLSTPQLEDEFKVFADRGGSSWWCACIMAKAVQGINASDFDVMLSAALKSAKSRTQAARIRKDFSEMRANSLALPARSKQRTTGELYSELQSKVLAA